MPTPNTFLIFHSTSSLHSSLPSLPDCLVWPPLLEPVAHHRDNRGIIFLNVVVEAENRRVGLVDLGDDLLCVFWCLELVELDAGAG